MVTYGALADSSIARGALSSSAPAAALRHVNGIARDNKAIALLSIAGIFKRAGFTLDTYREAMKLVRQHARIVAHFHPDRFGGKPATSSIAYWPRVCTEISLKPDYRAEARLPFPVANAMNGSGRYSEGHTIQQGWWVRTAPNTHHSSWSGSPMDRRRDLDRAIWCYEAWARALPSRSWAVNTRMPLTAPAHWQNRTR